MGGTACRGLRAGRGRLGSDCPFVPPRGQVAFITGGGSGIGFRIAEIFMRCGEPGGAAGCGGGSARGGLAWPPWAPVERGGEKLPFP